MSCHISSQNIVLQSVWLHRFVPRRSETKERVCKAKVSTAFLLWILWSQDTERMFYHDMSTTEIIFPKTTPAFLSSRISVEPKDGFWKPSGRFSINTQGNWPAGIQQQINELVREVAWKIIRFEVVLAMIMMDLMWAHCARDKHHFSLSTAILWQQYHGSRTFPSKLEEMHVLKCSSGDTPRDSPLRKAMHLVLLSVKNRTKDSCGTKYDHVYGLGSGQGSVLSAIQFATYSYCLGRNLLHQQWLPQKKILHQNSKSSTHSCCRLYNI